MIPTLESVPPKPFLIDVNKFNVVPSANSVVVTGKPPTRPITIAERIIARNAWIFVFKTRIISKMIPIARPISILSPLNVPTIKNSSLNND